MVLQTSSSLADSKALTAGDAKVGASVEEPEVGNVSIICLIFSQKNKAYLFARLLYEL